MQLELNAKNVAVIVTLIGFLSSGIGWILAQTQHKEVSESKWEEYETIWEEPIQQRRERVNKGLKLLEQQEAR